MKKTLIILVLCTLTIGAVAQTKKVVKTRNVTTQYIAQPAIMYIGIGGGEYIYKGKRTIDRRSVHIEDAPYEYQTGIVGLQGGYLYSLFGDMNKSLTPYVGGEGILGLASAYGVSLAIQASAVAGVMIGGPSFRLDIRLLPQLTYFGDGEYRYIADGNYYADNERASSLRPNLALRAGVWFNHFNFYLQYNNTVSAGIAWRL
ncbi:MAG: hypothetical protein IJ524_01215 [Bacteroidales bacterium]|nr:hypothetical protein [Bacteroidales bacterium]